LQWATHFCTLKIALKTSLNRSDTTPVRLRDTMSMSIAIVF
jgi:hypothetical protein